MNKVCTFLFLAALAVSLAACGGAAENKPANTAVANTKPAAPAAPTTDALLEMEKKAQEAYSKGDGTHFEGILSDKMVMSMGKEHMDKAGVVAMIKTAKCDMTDGVKLSEPQMSKIDNDTYAFSYRNDSTGKCTENGKTVEMKPMRAATIWVRNGEKWQAAWHAETDIIEAKKDAPKAEAKKDEAKKAESAKAESATADVSKDEAKKAEVKKEEATSATSKKEAARLEGAKKDEVKKDAAAKDEKPAAPAKLVASANTEALTKIHQAGWDAWKNKDAKWFDQNTTATLAFVDPAGKSYGNKADVIKLWTEGMKCEGVTKVSVTDGFGFALSPTVEVFEHKGTSDGSCDGQKNGPLWGTAVYVKEGDTWKLAYLFEMPAKRM